MSEKDSYTSEEWEKRKRKAIEKFKEEEGVSAPNVIQSKLGEDEEITVRRRKIGKGEGSTKDKELGFKTMKELTKKKAKELGVTVDMDTIKDEGDLVGIITTLQGIERKQSQGERRGSSGTAPLSSAGGYEENEGGYESYEAMVKDLKTRTVLGVPAEKREAQKILDELVRKGLIGIAKHKNKSTEVKIPSDEQMKDGLGLKDLINEEFRKKMLHRKKERKKRVEEDYYD